MRAYAWMAAAAVAGLAMAVLVAHPAGSQAAQRKDRVFELRTYVPAPGKLDALLARFRDQTVKLFEKHGMVNCGYWVTSEPIEGEKRLVYLLAHKSREAAAASWRAFIDDPAWHQARDASEVNGRLAVKVESIYLNPTDFSKLK